MGEQLIRRVSSSSVLELDTRLSMRVVHAVHSQIQPESSSLDVERDVALISIEPKNIIHLLQMYCSTGTVSKGHYTCYTIHSKKLKLALCSILIIIAKII